MSKKCYVCGADIKIASVFLDETDESNVGFEFICSNDQCKFNPILWLFEEEVIDIFF